MPRVSWIPLSLCSVLLGSALAQPAPPPTTPTVPLKSAIVRVVDTPRLRIVRAASGKTTEERFRAVGREDFKAGEPLVLIVRGEVYDVADPIAVVRSERTGKRVTIDIEGRRFLGPRTVSGPVVPLVEVALGTLPVGDYTIVVKWNGLEYTDAMHPERATNPKLELHAMGMPLQVR